jgi:hypothetical protein
LRLPPAQLALQPGDQLQLPFNSSLWLVDKATIDGFVVVVELHPATSGSVAVAADPGRIVANDDVEAGPLSIALLDIPNVFAPGSDEPALLLAASNTTAGWKRAPVQITFGGQSVTVETARTKSVLGSAATVLAPAATDLIDDQSSVEVTLFDPDQWLTSCDDDALAAGDNLAVLGGELIQFGQAVALGGGRFRLSRLLRGRGGTEWACNGHAANESFCLIQSGAMQAVTMPGWSIGSIVAADANGASASVAFSAEGLRPPSPVNVQAERQPDGSLLLTWIRRSRLGFAWVDEIDAPLGEAREQYRVDIVGSAGSIERIVDEPAVTIAAADIGALGFGAASIEVRQIGDMAASRPAQLATTF